MVSDLHLVPEAGLEPAQLTPLRPQHSVSTNSTTRAKSYFPCSGVVTGTSLAAAGTAWVCAAGASVVTGTSELAGT